MKCTDRIGAGGSPSWRHERPPSVVPSKERVATAQPVVALMKSTPTNSSVEAYCLVQCAPSMVAKIACDPTVQPRRGPTIWMAARAGTKPGSMPEGVGLAEADGDGVDSGEALADGEALRLGLGVALAPAAAAQPPSTTAAALAAQAGPTVPTGSRLTC